MTEEQLARVPDVTHPMVRTHPMLGTKSLYFSPGHTRCVEGWSEEESQELIEELLQHATAPDLVYEHRWKVGDVLMWDNTQTMHRRDPFDADELRLLKRVSFMYPPDKRVPY